MPNLNSKTVRWQRYEPDLPGNRFVKGESPDGHRPFFFELAADLSKEQFRALQRQLDGADDFPAAPKEETADAAELRAAAERAELCKRTAAALEPHVRFGSEPLSFDGQVVTSLEQYLVAVLGFQSSAYFAEVAAALSRANSLSGVQGLFYERLSGGFVSTTSRRSGSAGSQRAAH